MNNTKNETMILVLKRVVSCMVLSFIFLIFVFSVFVIMLSFVLLPSYVLSFFTLPPLLTFLSLSIEFSGQCAVPYTLCAYFYWTLSTFMIIFWIICFTPGLDIINITMIRFTVSNAFCNLVQS